VKLDDLVLQLAKACKVRKKKAKVGRALRSATLKSMINGDEKMLGKWLRAYLRFLKASDKYEDVRSELETYIPVGDEKAANVILTETLKSFNIDETLPEERKEKEIRKQIQQVVKENFIKALFGSAATEEDENTAKQMLLEAFAKSQSPDDPQLLQAIKRYILVGINRKLQEMDISTSKHEDGYELGKRFFSHYLTANLLKSAEKLYVRLVKSNRDEQAQEVLSSIFELIRLSPHRLPVVHQVLSKAIKAGKKVNVIEKVRLLS